MRAAPHLAPALDVRGPAGVQKVPLRFVRNRKSRRYILRMMPDGSARVTIPRGGSAEFAMQFASRNRAWLEKQVLNAPREWGSGSAVLFRGVPVPLRVEFAGPVRRVGLADLEFELPLEGSLRERIEAHLRETAAEELPTRTRELAHANGIEISAVTVRAQRSRWGSCSRAGRISLNWRLIQTPEFVRDYIIVHELMHRREMNHSAQFWAHVQNAFPAYIEAERWLRKHAALLR